MEKKPLIAVDEGPLDVWYESPSVMIVNKPKGIAVHPAKQSDRGTFLNLIFQHNRWLSEMETSLTAGVLHTFDFNDHGLMLFNKSDDYQKELGDALQTGKVTFSYIVALKGEHKVEVQETEGLTVELRSQKLTAGYTIVDLQSTSGNTTEIRGKLFPDLEASVFYCYQIKLTLPHSGEEHVTSIREPVEELPDITVYHAPP